MCLRVACPGVYSLGMTIGVGACFVWVRFGYTAAVVMANEPLCLSSIVKKLIFRDLWCHLSSYQIFYPFSLDDQSSWSATNAPQTFCSVGCQLPQPRHPSRRTDEMGNMHEGVAGDSACNSRPVDITLCKNNRSNE